MKKCNKALLLQELIEKFDLQQWEYEPLLFAETIIPVYDVDRNFREYKSQSSGNISVTGINLYTAFTVPKDEQWQIDSLVMQIVSGTWEWDKILIRRARSSSIDYPIVVETTAISSGYKQYRFNPPLIADSQDTLLWFCSSYTATGDGRMLIDGYIQKIR